MKKTIEELLSGNFRHEHPQLLFSQDKIEVTLKAGDVYKGELYFGTEDNQKIRGYITSSNRRVVPGTEKFSGTTVRLQYGIDGAGMHRVRDMRDGFVSPQTLENISCHFSFRQRKQN